jgi:hypothetical protein
LLLTAEILNILSLAVVAVAGVAPLTQAVRVAAAPVVFALVRFH